MLGADSNPALQVLQYADSLTPLGFAAINGNSENVRLLLSAKADAYARTRTGMTASQLADKFGPFPNVNSFILRLGSQDTPEQVNG